MYFEDMKNTPFLMSEFVEGIEKMTVKEIEDAALECGLKVTVTASHDGLHLVLEKE